MIWTAISFLKYHSVFEKNSCHVSPITTNKKGAYWQFKTHLKWTAWTPWAPEKHNNIIVFPYYPHSSSHICPQHWVWNSHRRLRNIKSYFISLIVMDLMLHTFAWKKRTNPELYLKFNYKVPSERMAVGFNWDYDLNLLLTWCLWTWMI